jgi:hypothetical protein
MCTVVRTCMRSELHRWLRLQRSPSSSAPSAAHFLKSHQLLMQNFGACTAGYACNARPGGSLL